MAFELTDEQKRADIQARIKAAQGEVRAIFERYQVEIIAILDTSSHMAIVALPHWIDTRYIKNKPEAGSERMPVGAVNTHVPKPPSATPSPITRADIDKGNDKKGKGKK